MGRTADVNWADKYKGSDHHTDRLVRTKVSYENSTGIDYPEPRPSTNTSKMAWGKGGNSNVVQVTTRSRRAYSVPAVDVGVGYEPMIGKRTAQTVSYVKDDADTISNASKRQDQRLLRDITTRLANAQFTQPTVSKRDSRSRTRRRTPSAPSSRRGSVPSIYSVPSKPKSLADEDFEIRFPDELKPGHPLAPCARRAQNRSVFPRSASLPPPTTPKTTTGSRIYDFIDTASPLYRLVDEPLKPAYASLHERAAKKAQEPVGTPWAPPPLPVVIPKRRYSFAFEDPEQVQFFSAYRPQTQTANVSYYRPVVRPYVRQYSPAPRRHAYAYRSQSDYQPAPTVTRAFRAASEPRARPLYTPTSNLAVKQARACLGRIERELGMGSVTVDDAPYIDEPVVTTNVVPLRSASRTGFIRGSTTPRRSSNNYGGVVTSRPPPIPKTIPSTRRHEIEARLETMYVPEPATCPTSLGSLRTRTTEAKNKMDKHKILLDRYLPVPSGTPNDVPYEVEYKFAELANRGYRLSRGYPIHVKGPVMYYVVPSVTHTISTTRPRRIYRRHSYRY